jgi:hypothetical protein
VTRGRSVLESGYIAGWAAASVARRVSGYVKRGVHRHRVLLRGDRRRRAQPRAIHQVLSAKAARTWACGASTCTTCQPRAAGDLWVATSCGLESDRRFRFSRMPHHAMIRIYGCATRRSARPRRRGSSEARGLVGLARDAGGKDASFSARFGCRSLPRAEHDLIPTQTVRENSRRPKPRRRSI